MTLRPLKVRLNIGVKSQDLNPVTKDSFSGDFTEWESSRTMNEKKCFATFLYPSL